MPVSLSNKKQAWLHAIRLRTLPLALASILMASFIAVYHEVFRWEVFLLAVLTTTLLQILSNLANDYGDSVHGADSIDRQGPTRAVQSGVISKEEMKRAMILFAAFSFASGMALLYVAVADILIFLGFVALGLVAIVAAITYTSGSKPYGYAGLGDLSVFLFFGLVGVLGTYFLHSLRFSADLIFPAISLGFFSTAVLNINNIRDIESDVKAGKRSIPVRIGRAAAVKYNWFLIIAGNLSLLVFVINQQAWGGLLALGVAPVMVSIAKGVADPQKSALQLDPYLKRMAISTLMWVLVFGAGIIFLR
ncbi:MAG TPA: 1,4-dihydroxy-2-naphthoate polyprenyltransferase [Cyclobacteriaceae bacterium]|nr:1,4-dihydroxy-2-naphthoate polyprenyltransferase [Cyclobacteriaceae bacterium]